MADRSGRPRTGAAGQGHRHRCREGHSWEHAGEAARACRIPEYASDLWGRYVSVEHCPVCTGQDDLLVRSAHPHRCPECRAEWIHEGRCAGDAEARCPWCAASPDAVASQGRRRGTHVHYCPRCVQIWEHLETCLAPHRALLPECPGCGVGTAEQGVATAWAEAGAPLRRRARGGGRWGRRVGVVCLFLAAGLGLGVLLRGLGPRSPVPSGGDGRPRATAGSQPVEPPRVVTVPPAPPSAVTPAPAPPSAVPPPLPPPAVSLPRPAAPPVEPARPVPELPRASPPPRRAETPAPAPAVPQPPPVARPPAATPRSAPPPPPVAAAPRAAPAPEARPAPTGRSVQACARPSAPAVVISNESGRELGMWVGVELDTTTSPARCLYFVRRQDNTLWVIDSAKTRTR